ncbi:MAG: hypothetical protein ACKVS6_14505, partial [Planctomycetota bacterium]
MIRYNFFRVVFVFIIMSFVAGGALATFANPASGALITSPKGKTFKINVHGVQNCTFNATVQISDPNVVEVADGPLTNLTKRDFIFTAKNAGNSTITITTLNGTCPGAVHNYTLNVTLDGKLLVKEAHGKWKSLLAEFSAFNNEFSNVLRDDAADYRNVVNSGGDVGAGMNTLRNAFVLANNTIANNTIEVLQEGAAFGTQLLNINSAGPGLVPFGLIDGTGGDWNKFEGGVQKAMNTHAAFVNKLVASLNKSAEKDKNDISPRIYYLQFLSRTFNTAVNWESPIPFNQTRDPFLYPIFPTSIIINGVFGGSNNNGAVTLGGLGNPGQTITISLTSIDPVVGGPEI